MFTGSGVMFGRIKKKLGIKVANCMSCNNRYVEDEGDEYSSCAFHACESFPYYSNLKSFPFKKEMSCWSPDFWSSSLVENVDLSNESEYNKVVKEFQDIIDGYNE
jgi:hypothetical protein